jgi:hypothetical protein
MHAHDTFEVWLCCVGGCTERIELSEPMAILGPPAVADEPGCGLIVDRRARIIT